MGRVHWVGGEKGGVGKSMVARLLSQYWIDHHVPFAAFDTDRSHGALLRHYADYATRVSVDRLEDLDRIVETLASGCREVVVDLAAQTEQPLDAWMRAGDVFELLEELGHRAVFWSVLDDGKDAVRLLEARLASLGGLGRIVCVLNRGRGRDFTLFEDTKLRDRIEQLGGDVIDLPALDPSTASRIDATDKSFWAALHNADPEAGPCLSIMERQRAKIFIRRAYALFDQVLDGAGAAGLGAATRAQEA